MLIFPFFFKGYFVIRRWLFYFIISVLFSGLSNDVCFTWKFVGYRVDMFEKSITVHDKIVNKMTKKLKKKTSSPLY